MFATMRRLHERGTRARGLMVDAEGVMLGPDWVLVRRTSAGFRCAGSNAIDLLRRLAFGDDLRLRRLPAVLASIATALERGDLVKAQLLGLALPIDDLTDHQLLRLHHASDLIKDFNPDQPRDECGRWTSGGGSTEAPPNAADETPPAVVAGTAASGLMAELVPWAERAATALRAAGGLPALVLGAVVVPLNTSNVAEGTLPNAQSVGYRYDEGLLTLYTRDADGQRVELFHQFAGSDGLYRDADGNVVARQLDNGRGFVLDPDALPALAATAKAKDRIDQDAVKAALQAYSDTVARSEPRVCPAPSPDRGGNSSVRAFLYQWQVCGLPGGWGVAYNGARYDGCDPVTGRLLECKAQRFADKMSGSPTDDWPWPAWFSRENKGIREVLEEMEKEDRGAVGRGVTWHVAEKPFADWLERYAQLHHYNNTTVVHTPPPAFDPSMLRRAIAYFGISPLEEMPS